MKRMIRKSMMLLGALLMAPVMSFAQGGNDSGIYSTSSVKTVNGQDYLRIETYVTGEKITVETHKASDIVLALDKSGSMSSYIKKFDSHRDDYNYNNIDDYYYLYTDGKYYKINTGYDSSSWFSVSDCYAYITVNGARKYLNGTGLSDTKVTFASQRTTIFTGVLYDYNNTDKTRLSAMKDVVNAFIDSTYQDGIRNNVVHTISLVQFGSNSTTASKILANPTKLGKDETGTYNNVSALKNLVNGLSASGDTSADLAMNLAYDIMNSTAIKTKDSAKAIIMVTDGVPNHGGVPLNATVANDAVKNAKKSKDMGVKVFDILIGDVGCLETEYQETAPEAMINFMNAVSSNYPTATSYMDPNDTTIHDYFKFTTSAAELADVFQDIQSEVIQTESKMTEETIIRQVYSMSFELPAGTQPSDIKTYTQNYVPSTESFDGVDVAVTTTKTISNGKVEVTGFDYAYYWCGADNANGGKKLIIEIPYVKSANASAGNNPINASTAVIIDGEENELDVVQNFSVVLGNLTISESGLSDNESAIYKVTCTDGKVYNVVLSAASPSMTLKAVNLGTYTVEHVSGWSWGYTSDSASKSATLSETNTTASISFTNTSATTKRSDVEVYDEGYKSNDFK